MSPIGSFSRDVDQHQVCDLFVRSPLPRDVPGLADLFSEMQAYYGRPVPVSQAIEAAMLACKPATDLFDPRVLLGVVGEKVVASIILNVSFPAFELTKSLYIRDLYVAQDARRCGIGQKLVIAAAKLTLADGFSALDWTTETSNSAARAMYQSCGARQLERTYYRLSDDDLALYALPEITADLSIRIG